MSQNLVILVGDRFEEFARNPKVMPVSAFLRSASRGEARPEDAIIGQGLSQDALAKIRVLSQKRPAAPCIPEPADSALTHKRVQKNIMISVARAKTEKVFEADLFLDDSNEIMEDHQTGQHIQGLALIEAARQLWTAVTERFFLTPGLKRRFVIGSINSTFSSLVFPLPSKMTLDMIDVRGNSMQQEFSVHIAIEQNGQQTTAIDARYWVIDERIAARQESLAARRAIDETLKSSEFILA
jgi:hypothetical protein